MYTADNISHLLTPSKYSALDKEGNLAPIHALDLALPRHFVDHLTGAKKLTNGGIVLGATSKGDTVSCSPLDVAVQMAEARNANPGAQTKLSDFWNPLQRIDQRVMDLLLNINATTLSGIPKQDAKSIIEHWAYNGLVRERVADTWVGQKWALSGGGVLGELEKAVVRLRF
jgi:small subunit ribosomal protein S29